MFVKKKKAPVKVKKKEKKRVKTCRIKVGRETRGKDSQARAGLSFRFATILFKKKK